MCIVGSACVLQTSSLGRDVRRSVRAALGSVVPSKKLLPTPIFFTIVLAQHALGADAGRAASNSRNA